MSDLSTVNGLLSMNRAIKDFFGREYIPQYTITPEGVFKNWNIRFGLDARPERILLDPPELVWRWDFTQEKGE